MKRISLTTSIISSLVIDNLNEKPSGQDIAVVILYCDYKEQHKQTTTNMIGSILKQLVAKDGIPGSVREKLMDAKKKVCGGRGLRLLDLMEILRESIVSLHQVFFCIDALDEFMPEKLPELLLSLSDIVQELPNVHVFLTGRPYVETQISKHFAGVVTIPVSPNQDEIEKYLREKFKKDPEADEMDNGLQTDIIRTVRSSLSESFVKISTLHPSSMIIYLQSRADSSLFRSASMLF